MTPAKSETNSAIVCAKPANAVAPVVIIDELLLFLSPLNASAVIPKRSLREMGQAIAQRLILTRPLAEKSPPRFRPCPGRLAPMRAHRPMAYYRFQGGGRDWRHVTLARVDEV